MCNLYTLRSPPNVIAATFAAEMPTSFNAGEGEVYPSRLAGNEHGAEQDGVDAVERRRLVDRVKRKAQTDHKGGLARYSDLFAILLAQRSLRQAVAREQNLSS